MKIQRNDTRDINPAELKLIRVGHFLWFEWKRALKSGHLLQIRASEAALEDVWRLKRELRAELKQKRAEESARLRAKFAPPLRTAA